MRRISSEPLLILYCYLLPFHLQLFNGYMTPCTYAIIWIKNRGYRIETQSRMPTLRFHCLFTRVLLPRETSAYAESALPIRRGCITDLHSKSVTFTQKSGGLSAATSAPQISVGYTID